MADGVDDGRAKAQRWAEPGPFGRDRLGGEQMGCVDGTGAGRSAEAGLSRTDLTRRTQQSTGKGRHNATMRSARRVSTEVLLREMSVAAIEAEGSAAPTRAINALTEYAMIHSDAMIGVCGTQYVPSRRTTF